MTSILKNKIDMISMKRLQIHCEVGLLGREGIVENNTLIMHIKQMVDSTIP